MSEESSESRHYRGTMHRNAQELVEWHSKSQPVDVLDPVLPIVDAHHHLFGGDRDPLFYRVDDLQKDLSSGHKIIGTVYCEAYESGWRETGPVPLRPVGEVEHIVDVTQSPVSTPQGPCDVAAGIVSFADMMLGNEVIPVLEAELSAGQNRLRGVRHRTATDDGTVGSFIKDRPRPHLLLEKKFRQGVAQVGRFGMSFDAWIYHTQLEEFRALADALPDVPLVLNHLGGPIGVAEFRSKRTEVLQYWDNQLKELAIRPNVFIKEGGMGMPVFGFGFEHEDNPPSSETLARAWKPLIDLCIERFGTERCMFESNAPVDLQSCSYTELWNALKLCTKDLSSKERNDLFYRTACRVYRLPKLEKKGDALAPIE